MEKVQFQLESTLPELKDLHEKGLFSKHEIDQITKRRTSLEMALIKRVVRKEDYFKYAEYEINLERLRKVRWKRLKYDVNPPPPSASTYSLPRRTMYILKRATVKFPGDLAVWLAYVEYASVQGMRKIVSRGLTSALQHHPLSSTLYLLSSYHHLHPTSPFPRSQIPSTSALPLPSSSSSSNTTTKEDDQFSLEGTAPARTTLLLGLRLLPQSHDLWREYIKLELGWVEALRRRWRVLGINSVSSRNDSEGEVDAGEGAFGPDGEDARKAILEGQLVVQALTSALEGVELDTPSNENGETGLDFRKSLINILRKYPSPLRSMALDLIYSDLEKSSNEEAILISLTKGLYDRPYDSGVKDVGGIVLEGVELIDEYAKIGKGIRARARESKDGSWGEVAGRWVIDQIHVNAGNLDLRTYLEAILATLVRPSSNPSATLVSLYLDLSPRSVEEIRSKTLLHPTHFGLHKRRFSSEVTHGTPEQVRETFKSIQKIFKGVDEIEVVNLWREYVTWESGVRGKEDMDSVWKVVLRDSLRQSSLPRLHSIMLAEYFGSNLDNPLPALTNIKSLYQPGPSFYHQAFEILSTASSIPSADDPIRVLRKVVEDWKSVTKTTEEKVEMSLVWAGWLLRNRKGREGMDFVERMKSELGDAGRVELESGWVGLLDEFEAGQEGDVDDEAMDEDGNEDSEEDVGEGQSSDEDEGDDASMDENEGDDSDLIIAVD